MARGGVRRGGGRTRRRGDLRVLHRRRPPSPRRLRRLRRDRDARGLRTRAGAAPRSRRPGSSWPTRHWARSRRVLRVRAPMDAELALQTRSLSVDLGDRRVLDDVTLDVPRGAVVGLVGPNGAGKTTLLRAIVGMLPVAPGHDRRWAVRSSYMPQLGPGAWDFPLNALEVALQGVVPAGRLAAPPVARGARPGHGRARRRRHGRPRPPPDRRAVRRPAPARAARPGADAGRRAWCCSTSRCPAPTRRPRRCSRRRSTGCASRGGARSSRRTTCRGRLSTATCCACWPGRVCAFGPPRETLNPECLAEAYGASVLDVGGVRILAPEGHHDH